MTTTGIDTINITVTARFADQAAELLEFCQQFLRHAEPAVRAELARHLTEPDAAQPSRFIDTLAYTALFLRAKLAVAAETQQQQQDPAARRAAHPTSTPTTTTSPPRKNQP
jgi:hypothetical protein